MKVEVGRFSDGRLCTIIRFEEKSNFRRNDSGGTWVPTFEEIERIVLSLYAIDGMNKQMRDYFKKRYFKKRTS